MGRDVLFLKVSAHTGALNLLHFSIDYLFLSSSCLRFIVAYRSFNLGNSFCYLYLSVSVFVQCAELIRDAGVKTPLLCSCCSPAPHAEETWSWESEAWPTVWETSHSSASWKGLSLSLWLPLLSRCFASKWHLKWKQSSTIICFRKHFHLYYTITNSCQKLKGAIQL